MKRCKANALNIKKKEFEHIGGHVLSSNTWKLLNRRSCVIVEAAIVVFVEAENSAAQLFEEVEGFGLWFWTEDHLRKMIDEFEKIKQQLAVFGNSMILDYSPYPTGVKDHDYKTWNYIRQLHAFFLVET
ncbi:hypothetical protein Prudu_020284 [Prunus dulcis]|uniref:Uncharacterized protein n=1 Tax=Prunus dulcis TaxID=3755 RepID=A0A4Y1RWN5_PRUDU|nr:hypothetical protein Prudu_020284 [Prunus dulcis]